MIKAILVKITEIPHFLAAKAVSKNLWNCSFPSAVLFCFYF